ncbi:MAG: KpsF/GutQ family sugar-phosphate isomerase [Paludibacteraceae bacterium]|nr:KpsF/GutQ family sugar-phosphate isomerase [Paludibacteraceae bacterium]
MTHSERAKQIFEVEIQELQQLQHQIGDSFDRTVETIYACRGKLVIMGIGKTGIIGHKIASSMASTGTQAIFVNAAEAVHGDLGMVCQDDVVMLVSNSGETNEILSVIDPLRKIGCRIIAMTGDEKSRLAKSCDIVLSTHVDREACPLGLAPTTSTTATSMIGDALMVCLMEKRRFRAENFAVYHPGGALGRKLLGRVGQHMQEYVPRVQISTPLRQLVLEMSKGHMGMTMVYEDKTCRGIITDGDLRRAIESKPQLDALVAGDIMTPSYKRIHRQALMSDALELMDKHNITTLAVTETEQSTEIIGILSIHHIIDFN